MQTSVDKALVVGFFYLIGMLAGGCTARDVNVVPTDSYYIRVFGCLMPIPRDYALHSGESGQLRFSKLWPGAGEIKYTTEDLTQIASHEEVAKVSSSRTERLARVDAGRLTITTFRTYNPLSAQGFVDSAVIDDGKSYLGVVGPDASRVEDMVEECNKTTGR